MRRIAAFSLGQSSIRHIRCCVPSTPKATANEPASRHACAFSGSSDAFAFFHRAAQQNYSSGTSRQGRDATYKRCAVQVLIPGEISVEPLLKFNPPHQDL